MKASDIRRAFFDFFREKEHRIVEPAPVVVRDDPTLMFVNAGMNQFKDIFLGDRSPDSKRVANSQVCLRVSGKHNDLEEVGVDTYHHTLFEMLGNWSFGDYFKKEAILWAWEFLVDRLKVDRERLYLTVFEGDREDGLSADQEAFEYGKTCFPEDRIIFFPKSENFWEMGNTGPCGPSAEIHIDIRSAAERKQKAGKELINKDHPEVVELWNLVFIEFDRKADGTLNALPEKHIDTGLGLERLTMVLQDERSNYDTDVFRPLMRKLEEETGMTYDEKEGQEAVAFRVVADHIRAVAFGIADGQLPGNTGAGYVIRRILRRAIRYAYSFLGLKEPFFHRLYDTLEREMGEAFPQLKEQRDLVKKVIREEELSFLRTLGIGLKKLEEFFAGREKKDEKRISGRFAFELYDTYGFPVDLTRLIAREKGWEIDMEGFQQALNEQRERARSASAQDVGDWTVLREDAEESVFRGYETLETPVVITRYRELTGKKGTAYHLVLNNTPFYAESGGQVGDTGYLVTPEGERLRVQDTKKVNELTVHVTNALPSDPYATFTGVVDPERREATALNHTATHLLHGALKEILGDHVEQRGSLVAPDQLRFDLSHFEKISREELDQVERQVNEAVRSDHHLEEKRDLPFKEALEMGAVALFGEKYGDRVRVVRFGDSIELCGGTHANATGRIGIFKIVQETAVSAGVRRVQALTGSKAEEYLRAQDQKVLRIGELLKGGENDPVDRVSRLLEDKKEQEKRIEELEQYRVQAIKNELLEKFQKVGPVNFLAEQVDLEPKRVKDLLFQLKGKLSPLFAVLASDSGGKASLSLILSEDLVNEKDIRADRTVKELAKHIQGGGGGQSFFATAGGKDPDGLNEALEEAKRIARGI